MRIMSDQAKREKIESMYEKARRAFPDIQEVTAEELQNLLREGDIVLVDVRTPEEQAVSMIPGAITARQFEDNIEDHEGATVVSYCTIGGRSGRYTQELAARGVKALNFKGAILAWTLAGGARECAAGPTRKVHVHGRKFDLTAEGYEPVW